MKKNLGWITMAAVVASSPLSQARAGDDAVPYQACSPKKVHLVKTEAERVAWDKAHPGCAASITISAPSWGANLKTSLEAVQIQDLMARVAEKQYKPDLQKRIDYWEQTKKCFDNPASSDVCQKRVDKIQSDYGAFVGDLRKDLAQTNVTKKDGKVVPSSQLKAFSLNAPYIPNAFPEAVTGAPLQAEELEAATASANSKKGNVEKAAGKDYAETLNRGIEGGLYLVSYLPKPDPASSKNGNPGWSKDQWKSTIDHLIKDAKEEQKVTQEALDSKVLSSGAFSTKDVLGFVGKKDRDLMYFATMTPEMEKFLTKHPDFCGTALAAAQWMKNMEHDKMVSNFVAFTVGGVGSGVAKAAEEGTIKLGLFGKAIAKGAALGGGTVGVSMILTDMDKSVYKAKETYKQLAKIGSEKGAEGDVASAKQYAEAKAAAESFWTNNGVAMLGMGAAFTGARYAAKGAAPYAAKLAKASIEVFSKNAPKAKEALKLLFRNSNEPKKLAVELEKNMAPESRQALADPEVGYEIKRAESIAADMKDMEAQKMINGDESAEIREMLAEHEQDVANDLRLKNECKSEQECRYKAIEKESKILGEAKGKCTKMAKNQLAR